MRISIPVPGIIEAFIWRGAAAAGGWMYGMSGDWLGLVLPAIYLTRNIYGIWVKPKDTPTSFEVAEAMNLDVDEDMYNWLDRGPLGKGISFSLDLANIVLPPSFYSFIGYAYSSERASTYALIAGIAFMLCRIVELILGSTLKDQIDENRK